MPRKKQFDPDLTLDRAMRLFWKQGYASTSVSELAEEMGINKFSLYSTYGDKRSVFLAAIDRYSSNVVSETLGDLEGDNAGWADIQRYFDALVRESAQAGRPLGCMMTNIGIEIGPDDAELRGIVLQHAERLRSAFEAAIEAGDRSVPEGDSTQMAEHLVRIAQSISVASRSGADNDALQNYVDWFLRSLARTEG